MVLIIPTEIFELCWSAPNTLLLYRTGCPLQIYTKLRQRTIYNTSSILLTCRSLGITYSASIVQLMCSLYLCLSLLSMYPSHNGQGLCSPFNQSSMFIPLRTSTAVSSADSVLNQKDDFSCPGVHQQGCPSHVQYSYY